MVISKTLGLAMLLQTIHSVVVNMEYCTEGEMESFHTIISRIIKKMEFHWDGGQMFSSTQPLEDRLTLFLCQKRLQTLQLQIILSQKT